MLEILKGLMNDQQFIKVFPINLAFNVFRMSHSQFIKIWYILHLPVILHYKFVPAVWYSVSLVENCHSFLDICMSDIRALDTLAYLRSYLPCKRRKVTNYDRFESTCVTNRQ